MHIFDYLKRESMHENQNIFVSKKNCQQTCIINQQFYDHTHFMSFSSHMRALAFTFKTPSQLF